MCWVRAQSNEGRCELDQVMTNDWMMNAPLDNTLIGIIGVRVFVVNKWEI